MYGPAHVSDIFLRDCRTRAETPNTSQCSVNALRIQNVSKLYSFTFFWKKKTKKTLPSHYTKTAFQILCLMLEPPHAPAQRLGLSTPGWV